jgi:predicted NBD/HSP70 family sugar kinase
VIRRAIALALLVLASCASPQREQAFELRELAHDVRAETGDDRAAEMIEERADELDAEAFDLRDLLTPEMLAGGGGLAALIASLLLVRRRRRRRRARAVDRGNL